MLSTRPFQERHFRHGHSVSAEEKLSIENRSTVGDVITCVRHGVYPDCAKALPLHQNRPPTPFCIAAVSHYLDGKLDPERRVRGRGEAVAPLRAFQGQPVVNPKRLISEFNCKAVGEHIEWRPRTSTPEARSFLPDSKQHISC